MLAQESGDDLIRADSKPKEVLVLKVVASDMLVLENGQRIKLLGVDSYGPAPRPKVR